MVVINVCRIRPSRCLLLRRRQLRNRPHRCVHRLKHPDFPSNRMGRKIHRLFFVSYNSKCHRCLGPVAKISLLKSSKNGSWNSGSERVINAKSREAYSLWRFPIT